MDLTPRTDTTVKISIRELTIDYPGTREGESQRILDAVNIDLRRGEFLCVVGRSGCGKSTLINAVAGFLTPQGGAILVDGKPVTGPGADRGVVFQEYALLPWLSVIDNVALGLKIRGVPRQERLTRARHFLDLVGLADVESKYPHQLSGGMKQRAAVARTLASEPAVILMDEPFAAIDAQNRLVLQEEVLRLWSSLGLTILFVTHSVDEAVFLADRIIVMAPHPGRVDAIVDVPVARDVRVWPSIGSHPDFITIRDEVLALVRHDHSRPGAPPQAREAAAS